MINPLELSGKTILVTGASSGLGRETAILLSQLGARLILVARDNNRLAQTLAALDGKEHRSETFDLNAVDDIPAWMKTVTAQTGPLFGLVHSAGVQSLRPIQMIRGEDLDKIMRVNVTAAAALVRGFTQRGVGSAPGSIVLLASAAGLAGQPARSAYAASKGAVIALTRSLAMELAKQKIRVNCIAPAVVQSEMSEKIKDAVTEEQFAAIVAEHPLGLGEPRDIANAVAFLLAETGRWITGSTLVVDGGYTAH